ncbi:streptomycin biosynthesis protein [Amycolatopsis suaedae]|uniref:Streptomycin biosynthesis protein n=1 Tax=Amycolatopsis suaedae TaxID=2510978 RepID=A0A4Q7J3J7_9PSEU|nr:streptomycin biosynthesis protein [Amycolatopsis suaedae]
MYVITGGEDGIADVPIENVARADSPRSRGVDPAHARVLAERAGELDPILVHRATMRVIDGAHRLEAARLTGARTIRVRFFDGSEADAFVQSVRANVAHGLPLSLADRKAAAARIVGSHPQWSDRMIAEVTGLAHKTVGAVRRKSTGENPQSATRVGRDGRVRRLPTAAAAEPAREPAEPVVRAQGVDWDALVRRLRTDPSLRHTESGRTLLRWLNAGPRTVNEPAELAETVPQHCLSAVVALARHNADSWQRLASRLDRRLEGHA